VVFLQPAFKRDSALSYRCCQQNDDPTISSQQQRQEDRLLSLLSFIQNREKGRLSCGLDAKENEQELVATVIGQVEQDVSLNKVILQSGKITFQDLVGDWKLLYTSSRAMIINKSLSGLYPSMITHNVGLKWFIFTLGDDRCQSFVHPAMQMLVPQGYEPTNTDVKFMATMGYVRLFCARVTHSSK
jgi:hypothetical protein